MKQFLIILALGALLTACGGKPDQAELVGSVEELYNEGADALENKEFAKAIYAFEELERQHPYSGWSTKAQVMTAYAFFRTGRYDEAIVAAERFIRLHPGHKDLPYMYYIQGLAYYNQISDVSRDQGYTRKALTAFEEVVNRFPESEYAQDAKLKISLCEDHLAAKEMLVGRYYQDQGRYLAAVNRFQQVLKEHERSTHTPEALYRLTETYLQLGITDEAQRSAAILGYNFPESQWYKDAYKLLTEENLQQPADEKTWYNKFFNNVKQAVTP